MVAKILAVVLAAGVLSVGGFAYVHHNGCPFSCHNDATPSAEPQSPTSTELSPCCQPLTRTSCFTLEPGSDCCQDVDFNNKTEVLTVMPREVN